MLIRFRLLVIVSQLVLSSENSPAPRSESNCDVLQCRWIFHCPAWRRAKRQHRLPSSPGSLLSRQPPVKTHDHHSFSLYHHNVPRPYRLTISYTLKFMTSSQRQNWFSMLWFPFSLLEPIQIFIFDGSDNMMCWIFALFNYFWCRGVSFDGAQRTRGSGPVCDNKQRNTEILYGLHIYNRSLFPLQNVTINACHVCKV